MAIWNSPASPAPIYYRPFHGNQSVGRKLYPRWILVFFRITRNGTCNNLLLDKKRAARNGGKEIYQLKLQEFMSTSVWIMLGVIGARLGVIRGVYRDKLNQNIGLLISVVYFLIVSYGSQRLLNCSFMVGLVIAAATYTAIALPIKYFIKTPNPS